MPVNQRFYGFLCFPNGKLAEKSVLRNLYCIPAIAERIGG